MVQQVTEELGPVDVLVNNAAACFYLSIDETSERRLRVAYEVNAITPYLLEGHGSGHARSTAAAGSSTSRR